MLSVNYIQNYLTDEQVKIDNIYYTKLNLFEKKNLSDNLQNNLKNNLGSNNNDLNKNDFNKDNLMKLENYCEYVYNSFDILFEKNIKNYYYNNRLFKNKSPVFTFINSLINIGDNFFNLYDEKNRESVIKNFVKKLDDDLFEKNLYNKFNYSKNRKFNKADIQTVLKNSFQFKNVEKFDLLKQYISDYLGINIYIIHVNYEIINFEQSEYYFSKRYSSNNYLKFLPSFFIIYENEIYKPLLSNNNSIFTYSSDGNIINKLWKFLNISENTSENTSESKIEKINTNQPNIFISNQTTEETINNTEISESKKKYKDSFFKNLKINDIKKLCEENNIALQKKSDKTQKMINKLKDELIADLLLIA